jgi:hypothetical protein
MSKRSSKSKRRSKALPALGFAGVSLSMAGGACASISEASANTSPTTSPSQNQEIFLADEEISDVSLATFYVFDKENPRPPPLSQKLRFARCGCGGHGGGCGGRGGGCGCGGHGGCGHGGLGGCGHGGCAFHGGCRGGGFHGGCRCGGRFFRGCGGCSCGGCGGCGCGVCLTWPWVGWCWVESTPPAEVVSGASQQSAQTVEVAVKGAGNIDGTRAK